MKIAIFGLGYVGLTAAGCLAREGHEILGIDISASKVTGINGGVAPIAEPGLDVLIADAVAGGRLSAAQAIGDGLDDSEIAIVCVGTPSMLNGSHNMSFIAEVSRQIATAVRRDRAKPLTVVYRSTIRPGTLDELVAPIFRSVLQGAIGVVELVYNPEFLRESVAVKDFFSPPKIVIGTHDGKPSANMDAMNAGLTAPVFYTRFREAEFTKFVDNTFHALKVAFANEIGRVCVDLGISAAKVHEIFVSDTKLNVSPYYLRPGGAFGGSCLPKDVRALQHIATDIGMAVPVIDNIIRSNDAHKHFLFTHATRGLQPGAKVLMVGLAFKADSDDLRESPSLDLARKLLQAGYALSIYDDTLDPTKLVGQNLGYGYSQLPSMACLLIDRAGAEAGGFDRIIDTNGRSAGLALGACEVVRLDCLP
ncbi:nucleotide sugar dehydrogenase [Prosthecomicrobium hirschii]|uniref:nucleotide sugar dehydrogenase n=1 Tax=Prosthecodimorpha hirschii TaxID=665126 RepID=UPI00221F781F|nr:nucleotide sugar dehydrogenase [Prosthecomicrobium hirschii]MCW1843758.1 nucleotide sugar dehydrogenase [Prosthecomicrobium hirschii]